MFTTTNVKAPVNSLYVEQLLLSHGNICSCFTNLIQPLLVILKDNGVDVKAKPVLPHMDHHAHSSSYETQLCESVYVSAISSLSACQQPTGRAEMHCSPGHSLCITFPSVPLPLMTWCGFFVSLLSAWLTEESPRLQQGQLETTDSVLEPSCWATCLNISPSSPMVLTQM